VAGNTRKEEQPHDFYSTPAWCIERLIPMIDWKRINSFHEPCLGSGAIYDLIAVREKSWSEIEKGKNYLTEENLPQVDLVLTNPPFKNIIDFAEVAFTHAKTTIFLGKVDILGGQCRLQFWKENPPKAIIIMDARPSFSKNGKSDGCVYAWYVWGDATILKDGSPFQWIERGSPKNK